MIETKYTLFVDNKNSSQQEEEIINELEEISFEIQMTLILEKTTKQNLTYQRHIIFFINHVLFFKRIVCNPFYLVELVDELIFIIQR